MQTAKYNIQTIENDKTVIYEFDCESRIDYELSLLEAMEEEQICRIHHVDSREEARLGIIEYWRFIA